MKNNKKVVYVSIVLISVVLDIILHILTSNYSTVSKSLNDSYLVEIMGVELTGILWALIAFSSVAYIFYKFAEKLPGIKVTKGLRYGIAIGLLWLVAMLEGVSLWQNPIINEFIVGLSDFIPIVLMGLLLGIFTVKGRSNEDLSKLLNQKNTFWSMCIFSAIFLIGRYLGYCTGIMQSGYVTNPYFTFIWTVLMGASIGVTYILLGQATHSSSAIISAVKFGIWIFGVNWSVFVIFMPLLFKGLFTGFIVRIIVDTILVILSYYVSESLSKQIRLKRAKYKICG